MKPLITIIVLICCLFIVVSCSEDKNEDKKNSLSKKIEEAKSYTSAKDKLSNYKEQVKKHEARLVNMTPIETEIIINCMPKSVNEMDQTKTESEDYMRKDFTIAKTHYSNQLHGDNLKMFTIEVIDGAGPAGSTIVPGRIAQRQLNSTIENATMSQTYVDFKNQKVYQSHNKQYNSTTLMYTVKERYGITVKSHNMAPDELWPIVKQVDLSCLPE